jgi:hypothetical protein
LSDFAASANDPTTSIDRLITYSLYRLGLALAGE